MLRLRKLICSKHLVQPQCTVVLSVKAWRWYYGLRQPRKVFEVEQKTKSTYLPQETYILVCGGGVQGASVAYHLAELGLGPSTVVIEQGMVGSGSQSQSSGLIGVFKHSPTESRVAQMSINLYKGLQEKGFEMGWKQCGSLLLARTKDRMLHFKRMNAISVARKIECELLTPAEAGIKCPLIRTDDLLGALWIPGDGVGHVNAICRTLTNLAQEKGVIFIENCKLEKVVHSEGRIVAAETNQGIIDCQYFVNAGGFWARYVGKLSEPFVKIPLHPCDHHYLFTKEIEGLDPLTPVVRDLDGHIYFREYSGGILAGGFENQAKPAFESGALPATHNFRQQPEDWDHFHLMLEEVLHRVPSLGKAELDLLYNGPEAFSPDGKWILGESPEIQNYFVAAGMKSVGISAAGGVGEILAHWIVNGYPPFDIYELDIQRFLGLHDNRKFLRDRVQEIPGKHHRIPYPFAEFHIGRKLRMSPIFPSFKAAGAVFGQTMGYERPSWFDPVKTHENVYSDSDELHPFQIAQTDTFEKPLWFDRVQDEYLACRERVAISDFSSYSKLDLWSKGTEVLDMMQYLCSADIDIPVGAITHTGMQNVRGGYENDISAVRLAENHFMVIAPPIQQTRCRTWISRHLPSDGSVVLSDVTSMYSALCVLGPMSRDLMFELVEEDISPKSFPFFTFKMMDIGLASGIRAMNLTHTGELGWVLYIPNEYALHVYNGIVTAGRKYDLEHAGYLAMRALRVEKFYAFWGQDLDTLTTPLECGRSFRVKFDNDIDFLGQKALMQQREEGVKKMFVQLTLEDHDTEIDPWPWGGEPIYRDGKFVGVTTTTAYGFTLGRQICLGFVHNPDDYGVPQVVTSEYVLSGDYEVDIAGSRFIAKVNLRSPTLPSKYPEPRDGRYLATRM